jgi:hypothetical protein
VQSTHRSALATTLVFTMALVGMPIPAAAAVTPGGGEARAMSGLSYASVPALGELRVGDAVFSLERVVNGLILREADGGRAIVLTEADLAEYRVAEARQAADGSVDFALLRPNPLGAPQRLVTRLSSLDGSGFAGSFSDGRSTLAFDYTAIVQDLQADAAGASGRDARVAAGAGVILVIVLSAAAIMAGGCAAHALLTDCVGDCAEGCWICTHCAMDHAVEGLCGTCECYCLCEEGRPRQLFNEGGECP